MDKNLKEKELFKEWGENCEQAKSHQFAERDDNSESYFVLREPDIYIKEYGFDTLPELKKELDKLWEGDDTMKNIMLPVLVASMKNKIMKENNVTLEANDEIEKASNALPMYIYNF